MSARFGSLPEGWTLTRVAQVAGAEEAVLMPLDTPVFLGDTPVRPSLIIQVGGLCVVCDDDYLVGDMDDSGVISCWASYGDDLADVLRGL
ncbi:hypothetical protein [Herbidospora sp. NBRC 101105]|uniref:hypothetical protein n=1 Tax=Herbidospora sp. NBRC 101105 TaxID=3032195 RepID=UPI0024A36067|nr:hypothetical protein [Herbidospora sp. NBRC 101105]GLX97489.1 hypothetical protein Hesp01_54390 [Herbidospora sp. NBRC 101105]